eukprot:scaffold1003_cov103-Skeletonema_marinoi.AAC.2
MMQRIFFQLTSSDSTDEAASNDHRDKCVVFSCPDDVSDQDTCLNSIKANNVRAMQSTKSDEAR